MQTHQIETEVIVTDVVHSSRGRECPRPAANPRVGLTTKVVAVKRLPAVAAVVA